LLLLLHEFTSLAQELRGNNLLHCCIEFCKKLVNLCNRELLPSKLLQLQLKLLVSILANWVSVCLHRYHLSQKLVFPL